MAPEDYAEEHHSDHQSDIWAVGVTLYEMLSGARPFTVAKAKDPFAWRRTLLNESPTLLSEHIAELPEGMQQVMDRALARDKRDRYDNAADFRDDLIAIQESRQPEHAYELTAVGASVGQSQSVPILPTTIMPPVYPRIDDRTIVPQADNSPGPDEQGYDEESPRRRFSPLMRRKEALPATVNVDPQTVYFGEVRKGDQRTAKIVVRMRHGSEKAGACVASTPAWTTVSPMRFDRRKQVVTIPANSDN